MLRETSGQHIHYKKISKPSLIFNVFINQTFLVNIYAESTANLQNRAGRDFFGGVQPTLWLMKALVETLKMLFSLPSIRHLHSAFRSAGQSGVAVNGKQCGFAA